MNEVLPDGNLLNRRADIRDRYTNYRGASLFRASLDTTDAFFRNGPGNLATWSEDCPNDVALKCSNFVLNPTVPIGNLTWEWCYGSPWDSPTLSQSQLRTSNESRYPAGPLLYLKHLVAKYYSVDAVGIKLLHVCSYISQAMKAERNPSMCSHSLCNSY